MTARTPIVLFLTGSGLSADSGLPTFRGAGGLYEGLSAEAFLSAGYYRRDPEAVEAWLDGLREREAASPPNAAHVALATYQATHAGTLIFTQNVDTLLERAGAPSVVHLHGRLDRLRCLGHSHTLSLEGRTRASAPERCPRCASRLRTDVVLFGESAPEYHTLYRALEHATSLDALVVIGTQGVVLPVREFARAFPGMKILNDPHPGPHLGPELFDHVLEARAADAAPELIALLTSKPRAES